MTSGGEVFRLQLVMLAGAWRVEKAVSWKVKACWEQEVTDGMEVLDKGSCRGKSLQLAVVKKYLR